MFGSKLGKPPSVYTPRSRCMHRWYSTCSTSNWVDRSAVVFIMSLIPADLATKRFQSMLLKPKHAGCRGSGTWGHSAGDPPLPDWVNELKDYYAQLPPLAQRDPAPEHNPDYPHTLDLRRQIKS